MARHRFEAEALVNKELLASAARTATGQGAAVINLAPYTVATFFLNVTAAATAAGDTLEVAIQRLLPDGATWDTFVDFNAVLGDGGAVNYIAEVAYGEPSTTNIRAADTSTTNPTLAAGNLFNVPWGDQLRVIWVVATADTPSFTFSVTANFRV